LLGVRSRNSRRRTGREPATGGEQEAALGRAREPLAEAGEHEAISRPPTRPIDLALEEAQLVAENKSSCRSSASGARRSMRAARSRRKTEHRRGRSTVGNPGTMTHLHVAGHRRWRRDFLDRTAMAGVWRPFSLVGRITLRLRHARRAQAWSEPAGNRQAPYSSAGPLGRSGRTTARLITVSARRRRRRDRCAPAARRSPSRCRGCRPIRRIGLSRR
jgi:hypothetical protein